MRGPHRPDRWPNIFVSDAAQTLPAWVELSFPNPVTFNHIQITFDTNTLRRVGLPLFRYPECVKRYEIAVAGNGGWKTVVQQDDNYFRRRVHRIAEETTSRVRIHILETNGAPQARVYEVRLYHEEQTNITAISLHS